MEGISSGPPKLSRALFILAVAVGIAGTVPLTTLGQTAPTTQSQPSGDASGSVVVIAAVEAYWSADQYAKTSGYVSEVKHDIGDRVKQGEVLAVLSVPELEKNLVQAEAGLKARQQMTKAAEAAVNQSQQAMAVAEGQLQGAQADESLAMATLQRQQALSEGKAATAQQLDDANARAKMAQASVATARAKVGAARADIAAAEANRDVATAQAQVAAAQLEEVGALLQYTRIVAPFDGIVTRRMVNPGDLVQSATTNRTSPLFTIQQLETVRVTCEVPESQAAGVLVGADAEIKLYGLSGQTIKGKVTRTADSIDPASRTMRAEVDVANADHVLKPGMYAQATIKLRSPAASTAPADAGLK